MRMHPLLMGGASGLPRNGLVLLADPYRDAYGRNVLPTSVVTAMQSQNMTVTVAGAETTLMETEATTYHRVLHDCVNGVPSGVSFVFAFEVKPIGYTELFFAYLAGAYFGGKALLSGDGGTSNLYSGTTMTCVPLGDGFYKVVISATASGAGRYFYGGDTSSHATTPTSYAGDTSKGWVFRNFQLNLGPQLFPYSAPAGGPGTLQVGTDYSGNGNHLTLGATTGASTDDPTNTGTAWSFDGGDYLIGGNLSALGKFYCGMFVFTNSVAISKSTSGAVLAQTGRGPTGSVSSVALGAITSVLTDEILSVLHYNQTYRVGWCDASAQIAAGTHLVAVYWTGSNYAIELDGVAKSVTSAGTPLLLDLDYVVFGCGIQTVGGNVAFYTGSQNLNVLYNRAPSASERARMTLYLKGLMARRGLTPSW